MDKAKAGDTVRCPLIRRDVIIAEIYSQDYYGDGPDEGWQIEFKDTGGTYRAWKQRCDGGTLISCVADDHDDLDAYDDDDFYLLDDCELDPNRNFNQIAAEYDDDWDEFEATLNMPCDNTGVCSGDSCPNYYKCRL